MYGVCCNIGEQAEKMNCFYTFDAHDYCPIAVTDVKKPVHDVNLDIYERYIATVESHNNHSDEYLFPVNGIEPVCRLYEIGRAKEDEENGKADMEVSGSESDSERHGNLFQFFNALSLHM
ncbi:hypothetical protein NPIL_12761 [Nephila pilipes]|uniref:Uncharacterized protein n=1 Tax=Nephila pilipes TaxID=299642 RepID=A0A8X6TB20_NEPPI|nr:hypothetical protein NPIL_12761 [Nephila pilipes]